MSINILQPLSKLLLYSSSSLIVEVRSRSRKPQQPSWTVGTPEQAEEFKRRGSNARQECKLTDMAFDNADLYGNHLLDTGKRYRTT